MAEDKGKEEEKFDFTSEGEGYLSLDEARVLAMRTAGATPGDFGRDFRRVTMVFEVVESTETEDHYTVVLSVRPQGNFDGTPGQEQFVIGKEGTIALRQVLSSPIQMSASPAGTASKAGGFSMLPVAFGVVVVGIIAAVGAVVFLMSSGGDNVPIAAIPPTETTTPTETITPAPATTLGTSLSTSPNSPERYETATATWNILSSSVPGQIWFNLASGHIGYGSQYASDGFYLSAGHSYDVDNPSNTPIETPIVKVNGQVYEVAHLDSRKGRFSTFLPIPAEAIVIATFTYDRGEGWRNPIPSPTLTTTQPPAPTLVITDNPTPYPTNTPRVLPTEGPTPLPTLEPTAIPTTPGAVFVSKWGDQGEFSNHQGVAVASDGSVYIADTGNGRIRKFTFGGVFISNWGAKGTGDGQFWGHAGITVASDGSVYVADHGNHRIQKFTSDGVFVSKWGTRGGGDGEFQSPWGVAVALDGNVYVVDSGNHRIQKFTSGGVFVSEWGAPGSGDGEFLGPYGIAVAIDGSVYVSEFDNHRIQKFTSDGVFVSKWGTEGRDDGQFDSPHGIAVASDGSVYIADTGNNRIQRFTAEGEFVSKWGTFGWNDGEFDSPYGVAVASDSSVYVADIGNKRIQKFSVVQ